MIAIQFDFIPIRYVFITTRVHMYTITAKV